MKVPFQTPKSSQPKTNQKLRSLLLGGILPVLIYSGIEEYFGILWGLVAGMTCGAGEILWEWKRQGKVDPITLGGNGMLLLLGGISLITQEGIWFKLQPSLMEIFMVLVLWGSLLLKKSLLLSLMKKQGGFSEDQIKPEALLVLKGAFQGLTFRMGLFFAFHAALSAWAALYWSTAAWAALKGIGLTLSLIVYVVVESLFLRYRFSTIQSHEKTGKRF